MADRAESKHFVAHVKIERVTKIMHTDRNYDKVPGDRNRAERQVVELSQLTIKSDTLQDLKDRITAHTALVVDHGEA